MDPIVVGVFILVYVGMILGELPTLRLDRSDIALIGAIVLVASGRMSTAAAWHAVDVTTMALLFSLMVISAQFRLAGFYTALTRRVDDSAHAPAMLLAYVIVTAGALSAILLNNIVCLAMAPLLVEICARQRLDPIPFLLALACASNVGSAATLIGNPHNILIGQTLQLSFTRYLIDGGVPAAAGLGLIWLVIWLLYRRRWVREMPLVDVGAPPVDRWQVQKGAVVVTAVIAAFLFSPWPRQVVALTAAGVLLVSRRMASREMLRQIDWRLLLLLVGLFVVNRAIAQSGLVNGLLMMSRMSGIDWTSPPTLFVGTAVLSNILSSVPAVMLLLPAARDEMTGAVLALSSTLAGNFLIAGSIANIIVVDQAKRLGQVIDWRTHARVGIPVTALTLAVAAAWLAFRGA